MKVFSFLYRTKYFAENWICQIRYPQLKKAFGCKSHLTNKERVCLYRLAKDRRIIVEIGSYIGASACCFGAASLTTKDKKCCKLICIDTWQNNAMSEGNWDTWEEFVKNTSDFSDLIVPVRGFSTDVVDFVSKQTKKIDILFIDGDHSYDGVKSDWEAYKGFLNVGSVVIFHDYGWAEGVKKLVDEDVMPLVKKYEKLPNLWWGTISKKI
jgi:predicted O-methyltransferase YrrM